MFFLERSVLTKENTSNVIVFPIALLEILGWYVLFFLSLSLVGCYALSYG